MAVQRDRAAKILLVDDEPQILRVLRTARSTQGYILRTASNGAEAMETASEWQPDLVITDLAMPEMDGVALCSELRAASQVPIIVLSVRNQDRMKIEALDAGADDYVTKPFTAGASKPDAVLTLGDFYIDVPQHRVQVRGQDVHLTPKQFDLLLCMAQHAGQVMTHRALLHAVWGTNADQPEYLRVNVGQLRKKIEAGDEPRYIVTEPWIGYRFRPSGNDES